MSKFGDRMHAIREFFSEVGGEMKKTSWPSREELMESTVVVIVSVLMLSLFVGVSDKLLHLLLKALVPSG